MQNMKLSTPNAKSYKVDIHNFDQTVSTIWQKFQHEGDFYDMTLACEDKQIKVHKLIISSCSPVLKNLLVLNPHPNPIIYLRSVQYEQLVHIVEYLYQGKIIIHQDQLQKFMEVAQDLQIEGLCESDSDKKNSLQTVVDNLDCTITPMPHKASNELRNENDTSSEKKLKRRRVSNSPSIKSLKFNSVSNVVDENYDHNNTETRRENDIGMISNNILNLENENNDQDNIETTKSDDLLENITDNELDSVSDIMNENYDHDKIEPKSENLLGNESKPIILMESNISDKSANYACNQCDYRSSTRRSVKRHIYAFHEGIRFNCDQCNYTVKRKDHLIGHIRNRH